jgi:hypothetical protein
MDVDDGTSAGKDHGLAVESLAMQETGDGVTKKATIPTGTYFENAPRGEDATTCGRVEHFTST